MLRLLSTFIVTIAVALLSPAGHAQELLVDKVGSPAPERNGSAYRLIEAALSQAQNGDTVAIAPGIYREPGVTDGPFINQPRRQRNCGSLTLHVRCRPEPSSNVVEATRFRDQCVPSR